MKRAKQLIDYLATQEEAVLTYRASNMVLIVHIDTSYLSKNNLRSHVGDHLIMSSNALIPPFDNGAILKVAQIFKNVMPSLVEAELSAFYINVREAVNIKKILTELGHPQP